MARREDVIWAAGFFDGEGCVSIVRREKHQSTYYWMDASAYQNCRGPIDEMHRLFGGTVSRESDGWKWRACGPTASAALDEMLQFMRVKGEQSRVAIDFQGRRLAIGKKRAKDHSGALDDHDYTMVKSLKRTVVT